MDRNSVVRRAASLSLIGNAILAVAKLTAGFLAGSLAVVGDGIDSSTDVVISIIALVAVSIACKPSDREHPYGHARAETTATTILAFIIFFAGAQLFLSTIQSLLAGTDRPIPGAIALWVTLASICGKLALAWIQQTAGKKANSSLLLANAKNMRNDVIISASVFVGLVLSTGLNAPIADSIVALFVGAWVMKSSLGIFREANDEIMDGKADPALYHKVFEAANSVPGSTNPHRARVRRLASLYDIDLDIEIDGNKTVREGHDIAQAVEQAIKDRIEGVYDIVVHVEPAGSGEHDEQYGLNEERLNE
ncbi:MAG: cation diffusion facilitator family transporter [Spirochaetia bacterium]|jgi:cation diffusion facilitator family transporter|nr:cation diffusion facilitator family transporter [Spirochaetia bacterium]